MAIKQKPNPASPEQHRLVLASASPRRRLLLKQIGIEPDDIIATEINETARPGEKAEHLALRLAIEKAKAVKAKAGLILAADTLVVAGKRILGKAQSAEEAVMFLTLLSGRRHRVISAIALSLPDGTIRSKTVTTIVGFKRLSMEEKTAYVNCGEWQDKAGGYAIQGMAESFIKFIHGSYSNVVGLPLKETSGLLQSAGYPVLERWSAHS